jgi:hypothetical protein
MWYLRKTLLIAMLVVMILHPVVASVGVSAPPVGFPERASQGEGKPDGGRCGNKEQMLAPESVLAQAGCCWPSGVCGCSGGRVLCCNGSISPTCRCHGHSDEQPKEPQPMAERGSS